MCDVWNWIFWKSCEFLGNSLGFLWEFIGNSVWYSLGIVNDCQLVSYIFKVKWLFTFLKSTDFLHAESQLTTKSYLNMEGIDLFVKIFFSRFLGKWVYWAPLCTTLKIKIWVVAYLKFIKKIPSIIKKFVYLYFMQLFSADPTIVLNFF